MSSQPLRRLPKPLPGPAGKHPPASTCSVLLPNMELRIPSSIFTLAGFRAWATSDDSPDHAKVTFVDQQVIIDMSGEEIQAGTIVKTEVMRVIGSLVHKSDLGLLSIDSALVSNEAANVSNIPDGMLVTWESLEAQRVRLVQDESRPDRYRELVGTPDWVCELVSDSSVGKDTRLLREAYHRAAIPEYWLIDARGDEIDFQILLHQPDGYEPAPRHRGGWQESRVFGRLFRLQRRRGRLGLWRYTLQVKSLP
jgi:Uma2 family endonuclease